MNKKGETSGASASKASSALSKKGESSGASTSRASSASKKKGESSGSSSSKPTPARTPASSCSSTSQEDYRQAEEVCATPILKEKANGKHFVKERPKLPASTLRNNNSNSSDEDEDYEEIFTPRYPRRDVPKVNYGEMEPPDDDHFICKYRLFSGEVMDSQALIY